MSRAAFATLLVACLLLAGCATPMGAPAAGETSAPAAPAPVEGQVTVANARSRPAPLQGGNGAAFLLVLNSTDAPVRLISAASDVADAVELHETVQDGGVMKMIPHPEGFEVPAGGSVELAPGGKHVMLLGLAHPLEAGQAFSLTLTFDDGTVLDLSVPVMDMAGMPAAGMEGMGQSGSMPMTGTMPMSHTMPMSGTMHMGVATPTPSP